ncbi:S4 domain-containing protein YaaA [Streptococcus sanguinis]|uniref:S4 domain-containing protein YaaA n=1 Tax=Streptococcus sanguinis TaxID=1305 RepID=UPI001CBED1C4|nr:S4 domain-containing protein YaaA [Streptococcus sanguinis]MBZ2020676.1 S4 domain-containing protein YaaA [Streptococcus sanguinis]MBZ2074090.1 S4 domain-containing protein YaaA [Streptococcus sanguinis]MBZ2082272.1 S4 domain-containing protein YaaA [Streptococcus sanguinis]MCC3166387.1 S4 domain protein [Streptococcus sanguinis]
MEYKLFDDYITLQALLKETGIIQSGGAIKTFLSEYPVLFNGEPENRRGKKLRVNDRISLPEQGIEIDLTAPSQEEILQHQKEIAEKKRVAELVKAMNKDLKKSQTSKKEKRKNTGIPKKQKTTKSPVRFPGI